MATTPAYAREVPDVKRFPADRRPGLLLKVNKRQLLTRAVLHNEAGFQFLDGPGRREATRGEEGIL
jgi:hypothetical protein